MGGIHIHIFGRSRIKSLFTNLPTPSFCSNLLRFDFLLGEASTVASFVGSASELASVNSGAPDLAPVDAFSFNLAGFLFRGGICDM